jgi:catechol 2,3-dioxygenase-like lactoylglutathione lyase family enzyme
VVCVHDAAAGLQFYKGVLGLPLVAAHDGPDWDGHPWLMMIFALGVGGEHIAVTAFRGIDLPPVSAHPRDGRHVAFAAPSTATWDALRARAAASGSDWWEEDHGDQRSVYVADPSGNVLEITTPPSAVPTTGDEPPERVVERFLSRSTPRARKAKQRRETGR